MHYLKVPLFSFPHDLQGIPTSNLGQVVLYEGKVRDQRVGTLFRHPSARGCPRPHWAQRQPMDLTLERREDGQLGSP